MRIGLLVILFSGVRLCAADALPAPAPAPVTQPVRALPAAGTPKEAIRSLNIALRDGDADAIRSLIATQDEQGAKLLWQMADYAAALVELHKAAEQAYGADGANLVTGDIAAQSSDALAAIDKAVEKIDGNKASVQFASAKDPPIKLEKVEGRWKLPLWLLVGNADNAAQQQRIIELAAQSRVARATAQEITAGKYKEGAARAREVWRSRLLDHPATKPVS